LRGLASSGGSLNELQLLQVFLRSRPQTKCSENISTGTPRRIIVAGGVLLFRSKKEALSAPPQFSLTLRSHRVYRHPRAVHAYRDCRRSIRVPWSS
jgi:hypothetical protein